MSFRPFVRPSVSPSLKISVTTEPIGFYSSGYISIGPVVVLSYFIGGWDTPNPPKNKKIPPLFFIFGGVRGCPTPQENSLKPPQDQ